MSTTLTVFLLLLCFNSALGQTVADIDKKYGKPTDAYSASENIWMTPEYAGDGQVCRIRFYPKSIADNINYLSKSLPFEELREVLNSVVPPERRGLKKASFGVTATGGPAAWTTYSYDSVTFTFVSSLPPSKFVDSPLTRGEYVFSKSDGAATRNNPIPSSDDFLPSKSSNVEIVTVEWSERRCSHR